MDDVRLITNYSIEHIITRFFNNQNGAWPKSSYSSFSDSHLITMDPEV